MTKINPFVGNKMMKINRSGASRKLRSALSVATLGMLGLIVAPAANAVDGTITFNGTITANTCTVGSTSPNNFTVALPAVSTSALRGVGQTAGTTAFTITVTGCSAVSGLSTHFEPSTNVDTATGNLKNLATTDAATGVQVRLLNGNDTTGASAFFLTPINLGATGAAQNSVRRFTSTAAAGTTLNYYAQYYQSAATVGAGTFTSNIQYTMNYQ